MTSNTSTNELITSIERRKPTIQLTLFPCESTHFILLNVKISNEVKIGFLAAVGIFLFVFGVNYLQGTNILGASTYVYARYKDVNGLAISAPVRVNGLQVGAVTDVYMEEVEGVATGDIIAVISLNRGIKVPKTAVAKIVQLGLMSGPEVQLAFIKGCSGPDCLANNDYVMGANPVSYVGGMKNEMAPMLGQLKGGVSDVLDIAIAKLDSTLAGNASAAQTKALSESMTNLRATLANLAATTRTMDNVLGKSSGDLTGTIHNINLLTKNLADNNAKVTAVLANVEQLTNTLNAETMTKINGAVTNLDKTIAGLQGTLKGVDGTLANVNTLLESAKSGEGLIGKLMSDKAFAQKLEKTINDAQLLLEDIRLHPERYRTVLSGKKKPYQAPASN